MNDTSTDYLDKGSLKHPLATMLSYLQLWLVFVTIQIDIGWIKYITMSIGVLLIYLGLRLIRNTNIYFKLASQLSFLGICIHVFSLMMLATPYFGDVKNINIFGMALTYINVYLIFLGVQQVMNDQKKDGSFIKSYAVLQVSMILALFVEDGWSILLVLISIISFGYLLYTLSQMKQDILKDSYCIEVAPVRFNRIEISIIYCLVIGLSIPGSFIATTAFHYQKNNAYYGSDEQISENITEEILTSQDMKLKVTYSINERKEAGYFEHLIEYEWLELPRYTYMLETICYPSYHGIYCSNQVAQNYVYDLQGQNFESKLDNVVSKDYFQSDTSQSLKTYINPFDAHAKGTIKFFVNSSYKDIQLVFPITFGLKHHFAFPYQENYDQGFQIYALCEGTKMIELNTEERY